MSRKPSQFQRMVMSWGFRSKGIFRPLDTGHIDERVACIREWNVDVFFYTKGSTTVMIDAGYDYERLSEKMSWLDIDPACIRDVLLTHQDTDHVGALERDGDHLFDAATVYIGRHEDHYLTDGRRRRAAFGLYKLPPVHIDNPKVLLDDGDVFWIDDIKVEAILVPGHTWGHMAYLVDDEYLFTGDAIWLGPDGGYSFIRLMAEFNSLTKYSLAKLEALLRERGLPPKVITAHTGWSQDLDFVFAHRDETVSSFIRQKPYDSDAPFDGFDERNDTEERARTVPLVETVPVSKRTAAQRAGGAAVGAHHSDFWNRTAFSYDFAMQSGSAGLNKAIDYVASFVEAYDVVLDAGCGTGAFACGVAPHAGFVAACDTAPNMVEQTARKARRAGLTNMACGIGDICALDFADDSFEVSIAGNVLHLLEEPGQAIAELVRVTRPEGVIALPNYVNAESQDRRFPDLIGAAGFSAHHEWDEESFLAFLAACGLNVVDHRMFDAKQPLCAAICRLG